MTLDLKSSEFKETESLWKLFNEGSDLELEATFKNVSKYHPLSFVQWLDIVKYLRTFGMIEEPLPPKLNIMVRGGLRFTIVGDAAISEYCKSNVLKDKQFSAIIKERTRVRDDSPPDSVTWSDYDVRIKLRRELELSNDDARVRDARASWATLDKTFRYIKRYTFKSEKFPEIVFDASILKTSKKDEKLDYIRTKTFEESGVSSSQHSYEFEIEAKHGADFKKFLTGIHHCLRGLQGSYVLVRRSVAQSVLKIVEKQTGIKKFPGPMSKPLLLENMALEKQKGVPNIRFDDYNVTDKADGERCLLVVAYDGRIYLVSRTMIVYGTDRQVGSADLKELSGVILDGEWVTNDKFDKLISHYYAFDIFNGKNGADVTSLPFYIRADDDTIVSSRLAEMSYVIDKLRGVMHTVAKIPDHQTLMISMKMFQPVINPADSIDIFKQCASVLDREKPYHTDGLILTPNNQSMPKGRTWNAQFKWKPSKDNSVDFLAVVEKEVSPSGEYTKKELVRTSINDKGESVRYKTLRLFVASKVDAAFNDPRKTILEILPIPSDIEEKGEMHAVEFVPTEPYDQTASICYVEVKDELDSTEDAIYAINEDRIYDKCIVEMVYDKHVPSGWRWKPLRVRWDKTERFQQKIIGGTMNADFVAQDTWKTFHEYISEKMIRTGAIDDDSELVISEAYYGRRKPEIDKSIISGMTTFHNQYIKDRILIRSSLLGIGKDRKDVKYFDMSIGQGGDIDKFINNKIGFVLGCDIAEKGLVDKKNGAYSRYLNRMIERGGRESVPPMIFVQADASKRYVDGTAGMNPIERSMLRVLFGRDKSSVPALVNTYADVGSEGFDIFATMFTLHYMFKDRSTFDGWLMNLAECLKVGGYFIGCCFDGDAIAKLLKHKNTDESVSESFGASDIWTITKKYDDEKLGLLSNGDEGLGKVIDVYFASIGETYSEYLVSFDYLKDRLSSIGCSLLTDEECESIGLEHSTNMFEESHKMSDKSGRKFIMNSACRTYSYLHRWFIFKRKVEGLTVPPSKAEPKIELEEMEGEVEEIGEEMGEKKDFEKKLIELEEESEIKPDEKIDLDEEEVELKVATGPVFKFYSKSPEKDDLKIKDKSWAKYLSTYTPFMFKDRSDPKIVYPNLEAALSAEKYKTATNKPDLAQTLFATFGTIHQEYEGLRSASTDEKEIAKLFEEEGISYKNEASEKGMKKNKAVFNKTKWDSVKESVIMDYVRQRFERDERFRTILKKIGELSAKLVYYVDAKGSNELGGIIKDNGSIEGENIYGKALMELVGLGYE
jgi:hypothetical protein